MKKIPFDFKASLQIPNWDKDFIAVIDEKEMDIFFGKQNQRIAKYVQSLQNDMTRDIVLLSLPILMDRINSYIVALASVQNSNSLNVHLATTFPEVNFIQTGDKKYLENKTIQKPLVAQSLKTSLLRRIIRTATWTKWWKLPWTIIRPEVIAVSHNEIVQQRAKMSKKRIYFYQASELLLAIDKIKIDDRDKMPRLENVNKMLYTMLIGDFRTKDSYLENFKYLADDFIQEFVSKNYASFQKCLKYDKLPSYLWMGTGTTYSSRILALSVLRRGGKVLSCAHATGNTLNPSYERMYFGEFAVTNEFVEITPKAKDLYSQAYFRQFPAQVNQPFQISSLQQNKKFKPYQQISINKHKKPTVLYASNAMRNSGRGAPFSSYMSYLSWQLDLTRLLDVMDINLLCQPHPEGIFTDQSLVHPLRVKYNLPHQRLEAIIKKADVFLVDFIHSTTFGEILVTEKPIVRIGWLDDSDYYGVAQHLRPLLNRRCRDIQVEFDGENIPFLNKNDLEKALTNNWQEKIDSLEFRKILIGE